MPALTAWHAGWAVAAALLALGARWLGGVDGPVFLAALSMAVPGLAGLTLLWRDGPNSRVVVMTIWGLAALVSGALSGGPAGALPGLLALPFAAGLAFGAPRLAVAGAMGSTVAALGGIVTAWLSVAIDPSPLLAGTSVILAAGATALALRGAWRGAAARTEAAEASVHRVEAILASQPGLTLMLEPSGRVLAAYGTPPPSLPVDPLFEAGLIAAVHAPDRPAVLSAIERALAGADAQTRFAPRVALDRRVNLIVRRIDDPHGPRLIAPRLIAQAFDGTAQYAREVGMETQRAEAEAQSMGKTRFLANMSHELRTPLNAVIGFADIMRQRLFGPLPDRYGEYADSIHEAGGHLLELINDVLDVSKIEADRYQLSIERFDARDVVSAAMALVRVTAEDKGVELHGVLPPDMVDVAADRRALKQITLNLLSNAVKFTPAGGSVTVTVETIGPYLEIVVADTGVGIAPEDLKRLGRPFEQAGGVEQRAQGTGLGLSLVRALAELHNGRMSMDSTLGEGSAVTVRLPVVAVTRPAPPEGGAEIIPLRVIGD
ncbi:MAG TPA: HAMP domain-containing sensor histidine kinase [Brevundimonas sp.]